MRVSRGRLWARWCAALCLAAIIASAVFVERSFAPARAQARPVYTRGAAGLGQLLRRLQTTASALHTGAHPDDEDSALIARLARGDQARVAYLSLNRGEGGQNVIGPELFEALGVIRTEELLQARRLDGGEQLFTRAFDYGFSKTRAEAATKWGERNILGDMVRAIRAYRPQVIISRFSGTPADGHGHHQLAGYLTPLAFRAAADPNEFPEQIAEGLRPWQAFKLYVGEGFRPSNENQPTLRVPTGVYDPLLGRTYFEIAMEGRSQHRSQEMGSLELRGEQSSGLRLAESRLQSESGQGIFDGIDTSIRGIARLAGLSEDGLAGELEAMQSAAARARAEYNALDPRPVIPHLAAGLAATRRARARLAQMSGQESARADADFLLAQKEREFGQALQQAAGLVADAVASVETIAPGESLIVAVRVFHPEAAQVQVGAVNLRAPQGWRVEPATEPTPAPDSPFRRRVEVARTTRYFRVTVPANAPLTQPYWLSQEREGDIFRWPAEAPQNAPFQAELLQTEVGAQIGEASVTVTQPAQYRYADYVRGEIRRNVHVVPPITVAPERELVIVPTAREAQTRRFAVRLQSNSQAPVSGRLRLNLPSGWRAEPAESPFTLNRTGERTAVIFNVTVPAGAQADAHQVEAQAVVNSQTYNLAQRTIAYPHIQTHRLYRPARVNFRVLDLQVAPVSVGYIMGSGDQVPDAIRQMGLQVTMLEESDLATGDLARFDVIVVGVRASQTREDFVANNGRILDYVRNGGTLIVQYQQQEYVQHNLAPYPVQMAARVTDENAPVTILQPAHPAFTYPNRITEADFQGWVQERSLYNFTTFDERYTPLLESHDPGEQPQRGGQVYAQLGRGHYVYTSYAWFRQLPRGVPGAYRLFANLLSLPRANANVPAPTATPARPATPRRGGE